MNVGIIGCGLIGRKRAAAIGHEHRLVSVADTNRLPAEQLASQYQSCSVDTPSALLARRDIDMAIVSTTNDALASLTLSAIESGKHVLVEKPAARVAEELDAVIDRAASRKVVVKVGFNHRFHPALQKAHAIFSEGTLGPLMHIRARYGHGGRFGYEHEWRANPKISGGGELLDQGVHLIDLARWFAGDFVEVSGRITTAFWPMAVEDNGFLSLATSSGAVAWLHASCTEWKNLFSFEIFCRNGKLQIDGLGGSYGVERLTCYRMLPEMGPPDTTIWEYPRPDDSWRQEFVHMVDCISGRATLLGSLEDARAALSVVEAIYRLNRGDAKTSHPVKTA